MIKQRLRSAAFSASLKINTQKIYSAIDRLSITPCHNADFINRQAVKLAAVRLKLRRYDKLDDFISHMNSFMEMAAAEGAQFVAFPELTGMLSASLVPKFDRLLRDAMSLDRSDDNLREAFNLAIDNLAGYFEEVFLATFSALASDWGIPVAAGSYYTFDGERIVNRQLLFDGRGKLIGAQDKLYPSDFEYMLGVSPGEKLDVFETVVGKVALLTACDALCFETFWIAEALGAEIAVAGADPLGMTQDAVIYRANENRLCVVSPGVHIDTDILRHSVPASIKAPFSLTRAQDGIVAESGEVAIGRVDLDRISADFDVYSADSNNEFIRRYCASPANKERSLTF